MAQPRPHLKAVRRNFVPSRSLWRTIDASRDE